MRTRSGAELAIDGDVVVKLHRPGTDGEALATRLRIAATLDCFLPPLSTEPEQAGARWRTRWPRVRPVPQDPASAPWEDAAKLLARLHAQTLDVALPHGGPDRLRRALDALPDGPSAATVRQAAAGLPEDMWHAGPHQAPVHGDWHLGQMGQRDGEWLLIIQAAARGIDDEAGALLLEACARMTI